MLVFWAAWIAMRHKQENPYLPSIYWVTSVVEGLAYVGGQLHYTTFAYPNFLASLQSYVFSFSLLVILVAVGFPIATAVAMIAERTIRLKHGTRFGFLQSQNSA
jgi:hypothetical protein